MTICCKRRIHERDSNPAALSSGTVPYRLGYRGSHTLMGPSCYTAPPPQQAVSSRRIYSRGGGGGGGYDGSWVRAIARRQCCKRRIHERDSNPAPLSFRDSALPIRLPGITHTHPRLAQSVEHETLNLRVVGSSPTLGANVAKEGSTSGIRTQHPFPGQCPTD